MKRLSLLVLLLAGCTVDTKAPNYVPPPATSSYYGKKVVQIDETFGRVTFYFEDGSSIELWSNKAVRVVKK